MRDDRSSEDLSTAKEIAEQYTEAELRQLCKDFGFRVDRSWSKGALIDLFLRPDRYPDTVNSFDEYRDKIVEYVNSHRNQLAGVVKCPLKDDERGCYQCSDAMVTTCWLLNEGKMKSGGTE